MLDLTPYLLTRLCMASLALAAQEAGSPTARAKFWTERAGAHLAVCVAVGERAQAEGLDPLEAVAVSFAETRHTRALTSRRGAVGPMQALRRYWARKGDKDDLAPGLRAWRYYRSRSRSTQEAAGKYNGGGASSAYAAQVAAHRDHLARVLRHYTHTGAAPK